MTREAIEFFKLQRKIFCEDYLKICPKDSIAYQATLKEKEFYDIAIKALEQEPRKGHWKAFTHSAYHGTDEDGEPIWREVTVYHCSQCNRRTVIKEKYCPNCGSRNEVEE